MDSSARHRVCSISAAMCGFTIITVSSIRDANAIPSFARKYKTSCTTCHTVFPVLNPFGEAFRRNGYRFPSVNGSVDSDSVKAEELPLGQEAQKQVFPDAVWPDTLTQDVPLSAQVAGSTSFDFPTTDAHAMSDRTFSWDGIVSEFSLFAGGAFNDTLTYFAQASIAEGEVEIEHGYLLWSDILGPAHLVNLWVGRLVAPSLTSWGLHSSYLSDTFLPGTSVAGLYNATGSFALGVGRADGIEVNGIVAHRLDYAVGWLASGAATGLRVPHAGDVYGHFGVKLGGMSLDGEGPGGAIVKDPMRPWEETSLTLDAFGVHSLSALDNGTGLGRPPEPVPQDDVINAVGGAGRLQLGSLIVTSGVQYEHHSKPYPGTPSTPAAPPQPEVPGVPNLSSAHALTQYDELEYVVFPWLVPGARSEYTRVSRESGPSAHLLRVIPGAALLIRANIKIAVTVVFEQAHGVPPVGSWNVAGGFIAPGPNSNKFEPERVTTSLAWAF